MEDSKPRQSCRRLDEQSWRAVLGRFDGTTLTVKEFCRREGLTRSSFFLWRSRLRTDPLRTPAPGRANSVAKSVAKSSALAPKPSFVDLGLLGAAACVPAAQPIGLDLRIELGGGLSLHLVRR
jgi:hypothetical protein